MVRGILIETSGDAHRAQKRLLTGIALLSEFHVQEFPIETGVVSNHYRTIYKTKKFRKNLIWVGRLGQHMVSNAGVVLDKTIYPKVRLYQALVLVCDLSVFQHHGADLNGAVTTESRQTGRFKIQDYYSFLQAFCFIRR